MKMSAGDAIATEDETSKDRFSIFPDKKHNPVLQIDSEGDEDYINAVKVPSLNTQPEQFLTQLPMPTTVNDFWRLVTQYKVSLIVAFKSYENDKTLATYLPNQVNEPLQCGNLTVNEYSINIAPTWEEMKLIVQGQHSHKVTHLTYTKPDVEPKYLLPFVQRARALRTLGDAVVYTCSIATLCQPEKKCANFYLTLSLT
ncbi:tyrosine-protein phosphatase non-receptor type 7-like [Physella acuta]|uniref:tyrosine-protein phosphatase non-receptor type 7-like n=1 Tax=Physella acuta TaxID=109671 RepID=UPI0027DD8954|nr:tyrosine-protein phosphatase non-receptor type 7-like [Physella acuta]